MKLVKLNEEVKKEVLKELSERSHSGNDDFTAVVDEILENVRANGDKAVFEYTKKFDGADISKDNVIVSKDGVNWYTLAGSEHYDDKAIWGYELTLRKDDGAKIEIELVEKREGKKESI